jgi:PEP-CTERM motif
MNKHKTNSIKLTAISALFLSLGMAGGASAAVCVGTCGTLGANGVVTASPQGGSYNYVSTNGGPSLGTADLNLGNETNGSTYSFSFLGNAGDALEFYFNFVTSDGAGFADYAFVNLTGPSSAVTLFTARTTPAGNTVPGFGMPPISPGVVVTPATVTIIPGGPAWSPLGGSSGGCYSTGCGYTGWVQAAYDLPASGTYTLLFGTVNWLDQAFDTGLAFDGITVGGVEVDPNPTPEPASLALLGIGLAGLGAMRRRKMA